MAWWVYTVAPYKKQPKQIEDFLLQWEADEPDTGTLADMARAITQMMGGRVRG